MENPVYLIALIEVEILVFQVLKRIAGIYFVSKAP